MNRIFLFILIIAVVFITLSISLTFYGEHDESEGSTPRGVEILTTGEDGFINIHYFWSQSCPYCRQQNEFWMEFIEEYPEVVLHKYSVEDRSVLPTLQQFTRQYDAQQYGGTVPITFVGDTYFPGFGGRDQTGKEIEEAVIELIESADR